MYLVGAVADKARAAIVINYLRDRDRAPDRLRSGLPRFVAIEVTPEEGGRTASSSTKRRARSVWRWVSIRIGRA
jgi:hypothetical protein